MIDNAIKTKVKDKGLSVNKLEKMANLKPGSIYNIISGRSKNPSIYTVQSIAKVLDCSVSEFMETDYSTNNEKQEVAGIQFNME